MRLLSILGLGLAIAAQAVAQQASGDWSASLLERMLGANATPTPTTSSGTVAAVPQEGMIVRIYQLRFGKVGSPELDTKLTVLERLVPAGSLIKKDIPANSISVLTTPAVQEAVLTFVSAIDTPPAPTTAEIPPAVQQALTKLAESNADSAKLLASIGALRTELHNDVTKKLDEMANKTRSQLLWYALAGLAVALVLASILILMRRKEEERRTHALTLVSPRANQMLVEQVRTGQEMAREEIRTMLTTVAQRMQQDRNQLQQQVVDGQLMLADMKMQMSELAADRERVLNRAENMLKGAVEKFETNTEALQNEQGRVQEIARELQRTLSELDGTRDRLQAEQVEAQRVRFALERERAKVAALSLLLEDGEIPSPEAMAPEQPEQPILPAPLESIEQPPSAPESSTSEPPEVVAVAPANEELAATPTPAPRSGGFKFLPPDVPDFQEA